MTHQPVDRDEALARALQRQINYEYWFQEQRAAVVSQQQYQQRHAHAQLEANGQVHQHNNNTESNHRRSQQSASPPPPPPPPPSPYSIDISPIPLQFPCQIPPCERRRSTDTPFTVPVISASVRTIAASTLPIKRKGSLHRSQRIPSVPRTGVESIVRSTRCAAGAHLALTESTKPPLAFPFPRPEG